MQTPKINITNIIIDHVLIRYNLEVKIPYVSVFSLY
jgi:hypothetical protein